MTCYTLSSRLCYEFLSFRDNSFTVDVCIIMELALCALKKNINKTQQQCHSRNHVLIIQDNP